MDLYRLLLCVGGFICVILPLITAESVIVVSKRYTNNSYTCFARHTADGLEYHLTYNVCFPVRPISNGTGGVQCLYYECSIANHELLDSDGRLRCFRYEYGPPSIHQPLFDRMAAFHREWPIARYTAHKPRRTKRDFSWVSFLEKFSFMGRHQSTVSKQNEAYFHYNFMNNNNRPSAGGSSSSGDATGGFRPVASSSGPTITTPAPTTIPIDSGL